MTYDIVRALQLEKEPLSATAESRHIFRDFVEASARVKISDDEVAVQFGKRAHNPLLVDAGFAETNLVVPWWGGRRVKFSFG